MKNFNYYNPTNIIFGKDSLEKLAELAGGYNKILLLYGQGSIKRNGIYDTVKKNLSNKTIIDYGDVPPNPSYSHIVGAIELVKKENIDLILAVGGGSVVDAAKLVAAGAKWNKDKEYWDIVAKSLPIKDALPIGVVLTLAATGSESNGGSVISNYELGLKMAFGSPLLFPKFSILDPDFLKYLPKKQITNGIADTFTHIMEQYLTYNIGGDEVQERQAEALLLALIDISDKLIIDNPSYDSLSAFMWCATQALNTLIGCGVPNDWATHQIGHELTAKYGLDHGQSLMILLPSIMRYKMANKKAKIIKFATRVWGLKAEDDNKLCELAIKKTEDFFIKIGGKTKLADYNINAQDAAEAVKIAIKGRNSKMGEKADILDDDIYNIVKMS